MWAQELKSLLSALCEEARAARLCVRENAALFSAPPFVEHPHAGSRNLRERRLAKVHAGPLTLTLTWTLSPSPSPSPSPHPHPHPRPHPNQTFYTCAPANERAGKSGDATVLLSVMVLPPLT